MVGRVQDRVRAAETLAGDLAALPGLPREALMRRWRELYGVPPPPRSSRSLLLRGVAYRLQERVLGGLGATTRRRLAGAAREIAAGRSPGGAPPMVKPGTRLLRDWQGVTHEVMVLEDGVRYRGRTWRSLSAVAREITGSRWSGPLFFGLKGRRHDG